jgi:hypothetical protein
MASVLFNTNIIYNYTLTIISSDVERSFSPYKNIFSDSCHSFDMENIKKFLIVQCKTFTDMTVTIMFIELIINKYNFSNNFHSVFFLD